MLSSFRSVLRSRTFVSLSCFFILFGGKHSAKANNQNFQPASTVQQPTFGVSIDAKGVLRAAQFAPALAPIHHQRLLASKNSLDKEVFQFSPNRKISLRRLADAVHQETANAGKSDEITSHLAGLLQVKYVVALPEHDDVILVGPAEGWLEGESGRIVSASRRAPVILLEDLATALSVYNSRQAPAWVGCSIEPTQAALSQLVTFNRNMPKAVPQRQRQFVANRMVAGTRSVLGLADIKVFNLPPASHLAEVLIEADYRMKLISLGLEQPPAKLRSFFGRLEGAPRSKVQRWWFEPHDHSVQILPEGDLAFVGDKVLLSTEDYKVTKDGKLAPSGRETSPIAQGFADNFTEQYSQIASARPVFRQLRNMIDLLVLSTHLQQLKQTGVLDASDCIPMLEKSTSDARISAQKVPCAVNANWKANRLIVASGGVSIEPAKLLRDSAKRTEVPEELATLRKALAQQYEKTDSWWWD